MVSFVADEGAQVEAKNLEPYTTYYYQFTVCDSSNKSPMGRTKTTPAADDEVTNIGIAVYSCSNYRKKKLSRLAPLPPQEFWTDEI